MSIVASPPAWTNSAGIVYTPADFIIFSALIAASTSSHRIQRTQNLRLQKLHFMCT